MDGNPCQGLEGMPERAKETQSLLGWIHLLNLPFLLYLYFLCLSADHGDGRPSVSDMSLLFFPARFEPAQPRRPQCCQDPRRPVVKRW